MAKTIILIVLSTILSHKIGSQIPTINVSNTTSFLTNPSFEDKPQIAYTPESWINCGFVNESPPDVQPSSFKVTQKAFHGKTYLGLIVRDVGTFESVGQQLRTALSKDTCYTFSAYLMRSTTYESHSQLTKRMTNYNKATILKIWGGNNACDKRDLLADTQPINNTAWRQYRFTIQPKDNWTFIQFEACYYYEAIKPYNGNLLLDNISDFTPCACPKQND